MSNLKNKKVLVAEDDEVYGKVYLSKLKSEGYEVSLVKNGRDVVDFAKREEPDLILMDLIMPIMDGFEALKMLKADPKTKGIIVIVMSNLSQEGDIAKVKELGAEEYFVKATVSIIDVMEKIKGYIGVGVKV